MQHPGRETIERRLTLHSQGLELPVYTCLPTQSGRAFPAVQIHHGGGGYDPFFEELARRFAANGFVGVAMEHRGFAGAPGAMEYGKGEVDDIGELLGLMASWPEVDPARIGILGYSRGGHNALLSMERFDGFRAGVLWSTPVDLEDMVRRHRWIAEIIGGFPDEVPEQYHARASLPHVPEIDCPVLVVHGQHDQVVPPEHARRLCRALERHGKEHECLMIPGEDHSWSMSGLRRVWQSTLSFFFRHLADTVEY